MKSKFNSFKLLVVIFLCVLPVNTNARQSLQEKKAAEQEVRSWSLYAVKRLMTLEPDNVSFYLDNNKQLLTLSGCRKFLWALDSFKLRSRFNHKKVFITAERINTLDSAIKEVKVDRLYYKADRKLSAYKRDEVWERRKRWIIYVPVILKFKVGLVNKRYKFVSSLRVVKVSEKQDDFVIVDWNPMFHREGFELHQIEYKESNYKECDAIPFAIISQDDD